MKKIAFLITVALLLIGCNSNSDENKNVTAKLLQGESLSQLSLKDQNDKVETLKPDTHIVFFSFSKAMGHMCNDFLEKQSADFLAQNNAVYVADVSAAPSLIKKMFILPDLKKLKFPILLINDDAKSAAYSKGMDKEKIVVVILENLKIKEIKTVKDTKELSELFKK